MNPREFTSESAGCCLPTLGGYHAFFPNPLPPTLEIDWELASLLSAADHALAELSGAGQLLPNPHLLIRPYLRREAVLSSLIENTIAGVDELFYLEAGEENSRNPDLQEVANHVRALEQGIASLTDWPISTRLLCELHAMSKSRLHVPWTTPVACSPSTNSGGFISRRMSAPRRSPTTFSTKSSPIPCFPPLATVPVCKSRSKQSAAALIGLSKRDSSGKSRATAATGSSSPRSSCG